ncbi:hypothetical protein FB45DRAFT_46430 [Roridomyces roridus]|uniref:Uncharacterized protein n=1 Tax=Roridomyces roridus TaxID=1738132 RepID=A0AAD7BRY5_9AGAR|nr:hypothetical protein FB45DRAFT_46430 [Roridomyces roridus]
MDKAPSMTSYPPPEIWRAILRFATAPETQRHVDYTPFEQLQEFQETTYAVQQESSRLKTCLSRPRLTPIPCDGRRGSVRGCSDIRSTRFGEPSPGPHAVCCRGRAGPLRHLCQASRASSAAHKHLPTARHATHRYPRTLQRPRTRRASGTMPQSRGLCATVPSTRRG